jgi:hypothetical protein
MHMQNCSAERRFAAAGLADNAKRFALIERKVNAVDSVKLRSAACTEILFEVLYLQ